jgi:hypothetical protein
VRYAHGVEACRSHLAEVAFDGLQILIFAAVGVRSKRSIRDAANPELL